MNFKLTMQVSKEDELFYKEKWERALSMITDFGQINHLERFIASESLMNMVVFDDHQAFLEALSEKLDLSTIVFLKTFASYVSDKTLYIMTPQYYQNVYPEGIEKYSYEKLIAHELAHLYHLQLVNNIEDDMGPVWFYEGFAIYASNQFENQRVFISNNHLQRMLEKEQRVYYRYYGEVFKRIMLHYQIKDLLKIVNTSNFNEVIYQKIALEDEPSISNIHEDKNYVEHHFIDDTLRDYVFVLPGGSYVYTSRREGLPVSHAFNQLGFHSGIYHYREKAMRYPFLFEEGLQILETLKQDKRINKLYICGFSAGGHFALYLLENGYQYIDGGILAYPVVSTKQDIMHVYSFTQLVGKKLSKEEMNSLSLEKHVHEKMPPVFIWHTETDNVVSSGNSIILHEYLRQKRVKCEIHLFPEGEHGLSLATKETAFDGVDAFEFEMKYRYVSRWFEEAVAFLHEYC